MAKIAQLSDILKKARAGKRLNKEEGEIYEKTTGETAPDTETAPTLQALADRLGVALRTLQRWRKKYADAPETLSVPQWVAFRNMLAGPREDENLGARKTRAEAKRAELACEKLELEIKRLKDELVAREEVRRDGARLGAIIRAAFAKLEKELVGRLEGKTPAERISETRLVVAETISAITKEMGDEGDAE